MIKEENADAELTWMDYMPANSYRIMEQAELKTGYRLGFEATVPLVETQLFLPWLMNLLEKKNVEFIRRELKSVDEISRQYQWVINCSGLGSRMLCNDESIFPARGQVALIAPQPGMPIFLDNEQPVYIVPRKDATIIGGTYEEHVYDTTTEPATIQRLYRQAVNLFPGLQEFPVTGSWAGLRPFRNEVRLEKEAGKNTIHNYGHAGSGFTLAWGCAAEVSSLMN
jgi:D-amino-acid oxidase